MCWTESNTSQVKGLGFVDSILGILTCFTTVHRIKNSWNFIKIIEITITESVLQTLSAFDEDPVFRTGLSLFIARGPIVFGPWSPGPWVTLQNFLWLLKVSFLRIFERYNYIHQMHFIVIKYLFITWRLTIIYIFLTYHMWYHLFLFMHNSHETHEIHMYPTDTYFWTNQNQALACFILIVSH